MMNNKRYSHILTTIFLGLLFNPAFALDNNSGEKPLVHWDFEQVQHLDGSLSSTEVGKSLTVGDRRKPAEPQPYIADVTGNGNLIQSNSWGNSPLVFSDNVPVAEVDGKPNTHSLILRRGEYGVTELRSLPFYDMGKSWTIEASLMNNWLWIEQVYLCKEGPKGQLAGDVSIGFDNTYQQYFVEVTGADGIAHRISAGDPVEAGKWYDVRARAVYDAASKQTKLQIEVKPSGQNKFEKSNSISFDGPALPREAGLWVIGRGYPGDSPNKLEVIDGGIDEVRISGAELPRVEGQNPIFTDAFTADPAALVLGDSIVYAYVGRDKASPGGWFYMPEWLCYSTTDMREWTAHGSVLKASDFQNAHTGAAWAGQVVEKDGKFYYYVTLDAKDGTGKMISVAVADSPIGPFKDASPGKPLITDNMTIDSNRLNCDIDPTVFIDDGGTPWMAWGNNDCYMVKLNKNMIELDGPIIHVPVRNYAEGPWLFKRGDLYYNVYAADAPGVQPEQICYATAPEITGPWHYRGYITSHAKHGFTIHPAVVEFKGQWYFFYHDGSNSRDGEPGGYSRRMVCLEYLYFNEDGSIQPIKQTREGVSVPPQK